jgi:hypothetical protein
MRLWLLLSGVLLCPPASAVGANQATAQPVAVSALPDAPPPQASGQQNPPPKPTSAGRESLPQINQR